MIGIPKNYVLHDAREQLVLRGDEAGKLLGHVNLITSDIKNKLESLTPLFKALSLTGEVLEKKICSCKEAKVLHLKDAKEEEEESKVGDLLEIAGLSMRLWRKLKQRG